MTGERMAEPPDLAVVFGRYRDHYRAGFVWHRDDREGHGDPVAMPQRWWSHTYQRWVGWLQIVLFAEEEGLTLQLLRAESEPDVHQVCGAVANVMRSFAPDTPEWRTARLCYNAALHAAGITNQSREN
ncbi:hypothetical protein ACIBTV_27085 [Micromonospora sp. NPDC049366]|uniref:hypothetical protein n=1 Tax=Micromonospora sp. NPDC049366 TaxID=3364271 RepID=UPI00378A6E88